MRLRVKKEEGQEAEDEAKREVVGQLWARQRETDLDWVDMTEGSR